MTDDSILKAAHAEIRRERVLSWKQKYLEEYDVPFAPEPMVSVTWGHGYITMTLDAYDKLKAKDKKLFNKLGGM